MVRILSTGEIVQDDDPRLRQSGANGPPRNRMGEIQHDEDEDQPQGYGGQGGYGGQAVSAFDSFNERLRTMGIPRWNLGPYVVEPIVSVGFLIALILAGFRGLLFAGLLFFVAKYSQQGWGGNQGAGRGPRTGGSQAGRSQGSGGGGRGKPWGSGGGRGGGGHRLGRS